MVQLAKSRSMQQRDVHQRVTSHHAVETIE